MTVWLSRGAPFVLVACIVGALAWGKSSEAVSSSSMASLEKRSFRVDVKTRGELQPLRSTSLCSTLQGEMGKIVDLVPEGTYVEQGECVAQLDTAKLEQKVVELEGKLEESALEIEATLSQKAWEEEQVAGERRAHEFEVMAAKLELAKVLEGDGPIEKRKLQAALKKAEERYGEVAHFEQELGALEKKGFLNPGEKRKAWKRVEEEKEALALAREQYDLFCSHQYPMQEKKARLQLQRAEMKFHDWEKSAAFKLAKAQQACNRVEIAAMQTEKKLQEAKRSLEATTIRAPFSGLVVYIKCYRSGEMRGPRVGDVLYVGQPIVDIPDLSQMRMKAMVREVDLHKISEGMETTISIDAFPQKKLKGKVEKIGVLGVSEKQGEEKRFALTLSVEKTELPLRPGMSGSAWIHSANKKEVWSAPVSALFFDAKGPFVWKKGQIKQEVSLGACSEEWVEILDWSEDSCALHLVQP